jgi:hypothetical protein
MLPPWIMSSRIDYFAFFSVSKDTNRGNSSPILGVLKANEWLTSGTRGSVSYYWQVGHQPIGKESIYILTLLFNNYSC